MIIGSDNKLGYSPKEPMVIFPLINEYLHYTSYGNILNIELDRFISKTENGIDIKAVRHSPNVGDVFVRIKYDKEHKDNIMYPTISASINCQMVKYIGLDSALKKDTIGLQTIASIKHMSHIDHDIKDTINRMATGIKNTILKEPSSLNKYYSDLEEFNTKLDTIVREYISMHYLCR